MSILSMLISLDNFISLGRFIDSISVLKSKIHYYLHEEFAQFFNVCLFV